MEKILLIFLLVSFGFLKSYGQTDTISSFEVKTIYDSILKQNLFYERINKDLYIDENNYDIIENKIIKEGDLYKYIRNGRLERVIKVQCPHEIKQTQLFDKSGNLKYIIYCDQYGIQSVEKYNNNKIIIKFKYELKKTEIYYYKSYGYNLKVVENGEIFIYKITIDSRTKKILSKKLLHNEIKADLKTDPNGKLYFVHNEPMFSIIYNEFLEYCD